MTSPPVPSVSTLANFAIKSVIVPSLVTLLSVGAEATTPVGCLVPVPLRIALSRAFAIALARRSSTWFARFINEFSIMIFGTATYPPSPNPSSSTPSSFPRLD